MKLGEFIKDWRKANKVTQEELAKRAGVTKGYISQLENDYKPTGKTITPTYTVLKGFAIAMNMDVDDFLRSIDTDISWKENPDTHPIPETLLEKIQNHMSPVPFYEQLCCGNGMFADDQIADYIFFSDSLMNPDKEYFCMTASGDSMIGAQIQDGDYLVFEKTGTPQLNKIGCFCIDDNVATCKKFTQKNGLIILIPANDQFEPIIIDPTKESHFRCVGVLAFVVSDRR